MGSTMPKSPVSNAWGARGAMKQLQPCACELPCGIKVYRSPVYVLYKYRHVDRYEHCRQAGQARPSLATGAAGAEPPPHLLPPPPPPTPAPPQPPSHPPQHPSPPLSPSVAVSLSAAVWSMPHSIISL